MAKKKQGKKHKFKYGAPVVAGAPSVSTSRGQASATGVVGAPNAARSGLRMAAPTRDFSYVAVDLRRIGILAVSLVLLELLIWFLFSHTGLGNAVYSTVQVQ